MLLKLTVPLLLLAPWMVPVTTAVPRDKVAVLARDTVVAAIVLLLATLVKVDPDAIVIALNALVAPILLVVVTDPPVMAKVPTPAETPLIVPEINAPEFQVRVAPLPIVMPEVAVMVLVDAIDNDPEVPPPITMLVALIDSLAVISALLAMLIAARRVVVPRAVPEAKVVVPFRLTVPLLVADPSTAPANPPVPMLRVELDPNVVAPVRVPVVRVRVLLAPRVMLVELTLNVLAVILAEAANSVVTTAVFGVPAPSVPL